MKKRYLLIMPLLSACSGTQTIFFQTSHSNADIYMNGKFVCTAPCETELKRSVQTKMITCKKDGLQGGIVQLEPYRVSQALIDSIAYRYPDTVFCQLSNPALEDAKKEKAFENLKEIIQLQNTHNINTKSDTNFNVNVNHK